MTPSAEVLRTAWLKGTTCACKSKDPREVLFSNATHIVLCHRSHAEYTGRFSGTKTCSTYAKLYLIQDLVNAPRNSYGGLYLPALLEWTGRLSLVRIRKDCEALGIQFEQAPEASAPV